MSGPSPGLGGARVVELGELLRTARLAVACGGTSHPVRRVRLLGELSHATPPPPSPARLVAGDHAAGLLPPLLADPAGLPRRLRAAQAALRPARSPLSRRHDARPAGRPAGLGARLTAVGGQPVRRPAGLGQPGVLAGAVPASEGAGRR